MDRADCTRASHAVWEPMAPGWDERHAYFEEIARPVTDKMLELLDRLRETRFSISRRARES
jgi:hypothetical protein